MSGSNEEINLDSEIPSDVFSVTKELWHPEKARMRLAYCVLFGIFSLFLLTFFVSYLSKIGYMDEHVSRSMFDLCRTGLLPIVTLILGYYFSKNS